MGESLQYEYSYLHIISGEDYLLCSPKEMVERLRDDNSIYIDCRKAQTCGYHRRYAYYWPYTIWRMNYKNQAVRILNLICIGVQVMLPFFNKKRLGEFYEDEIYHGFVWGSYPRSAVEYCNKYIVAHSNFLKDLCTCKIPEELCFQTIIMNSKYREMVQNNNLRFWNMNTGDGSGPGYISEADFECLEKSDALFARKVKYDSVAFQHLVERLNFRR